LEIDNCWIAIRKSGTEPKIKYYSELITETNSPNANKELGLKVDAICNELLCPEKFKLIPQSKH
jgi:phosphomannomutase